MTFEPIFNANYLAVHCLLVLEDALCNIIVFFLLFYFSYTLSTIEISRHVKII